MLSYLEGKYICVTDYTHTHKKGESRDLNSQIKNAEIQQNVQYHCQM